MPDDEKLNALTPITHCPKCQGELDDSIAFGVKIAAAVVVCIPVLLVILDFMAKWYGKPYTVDDKILGCCLAGIALMLAFGFKKTKS